MLADDASADQWQSRGQMSIQSGPLLLPAPASSGCGFLGNTRPHPGRWPGATRRYRKADRQQRCLQGTGIDYDTALQDDLAPMGA